LETISVNINNANDFGVILHGTFQKFRPGINDFGLKRMSRQHIHMVSLAKPEPFKMLRPNVDMFVIINIKQAIEDGINFHLSTNNVVLSEGNDYGCIPRKYLTFLDRTNTPCCGVFVIAYDKHGNQYIAMVKTPKNHWSYPKGKKNKGEMSFNTAIRELEEETGIKSDEITFVETQIYNETSDNNHPATSYYTAFYNKLIDNESLKLVQEDLDELSEARWILLKDVINWKDSVEDGYLKTKRIDIIKIMNNDLKLSKIE
jgi:8-oxo-dGTP pyrophosphatase MutT (NUDIX family)